MIEAVVADAVVEAVAEVVAKLDKKSQRKNLSSISANTKTRKSVLSSAVVEKVSAVNAKLFHLNFIQYLYGFFFQWLAP